MNGRLASDLGNCRNLLQIFDIDATRHLKFTDFLRHQRLTPAL